MQKKCPEYSWPCSGFFIRNSQTYLLVKPSSSSQSWIQRIRTICGAYHQHMGILFLVQICYIKKPIFLIKISLMWHLLIPHVTWSLTIHTGQQLCHNPPLHILRRGLSFGGDGIDFVNKQNAGGCHLQNKKIGKSPGATRTVWWKQGNHRETGGYSLFTGK